MADPTQADIHATLTDALNIDALAVIGVIDAQNERAVLLRSARGNVARASVGTKVLGVEVIAIDDTQVVISDWLGRGKALQLPQS